MNALNKLLAVSVLTVLAGCNVPTTRTAPTPPDEESRSIEFREKQDAGGDSCTIPIKTESFAVEFNKGDNDCTNDQMRYFKLDNVRSATKIKLESKDCTDVGGWVFVLRTFIDPISTSLLAIDDLRVSPTEALSRMVWNSCRGTPVMKTRPASCPVSGLRFRHKDFY